MKGPFFVREWVGTSFGPTGHVPACGYWSVVSENDDDDFICDGLDSRDLADRIAAMLNSVGITYCVSCGALMAPDGMIERSQNGKQCVECAPDDLFLEEG